MLTSPGLISYLFVGALAGWVAGRALKTGNLIWADAGVGALGALGARYVLSAVCETATTWWWVIAVVGGAIPLCVLRLVGES
ncbi:MAG: GlsB/YeaQ/YmgE family stress response membrane protein [Mycobacterium sp.]